MSLKSSQPTLLMDSYSFHSFINAGYFYCWALGDTYHIVVLVEQESLNAPALKALQEAGKIASVVAVPSRRNRFALHRWLAHDLKALVEDIKPDIVLMNNWHIFSQKYLSHIVQKVCPQTPIIISLSVHSPTTDFATTDRHLVEARRSAWRERFKWMPGALAFLLHDTWGRWVGLRDFVFFPLLLTGRVLRQSHCPWRGVLLSKDVSSLFDAIICYAPVERQNYLMEAPNLDQIVLIRHPMGETPGAIQALFGSEEQGDRICVLPSFCLNYQDGRTPDQQSAQLVEIWGDALEAIQQRSGYAEIWWKLHPSFSDDPVMKAVTAGLEIRLPGFRSMTGKMLAEEMIAASKIVVGDISTALLWSLRLGQRATLSLNLFGMEGGDDMGYYPGITVVRSLEELKTADNSVFTAEKSREAVQNYPSAIECLAMLKANKTPIGS